MLYLRILGIKAIFMKISFSKKEYKLLLDLLYLADWMILAHETGLEKFSKYSNLLKKIFSYYKEMGAEDLIEYCDESKDYHPNSEYEDKLHETFIDPYNEETFWEEFLTRLAHRDLLNLIGIEKYTTMDKIERFTQLETIRDFYIKEFANHGIDHIKLDTELLVDDHKCEIH